MDKLHHYDAHALETGEDTPDEPEVCAHCGEVCGDSYLLVSDGNGNAVAACHSVLRNCFFLVTYCGHQVEACPKCEPRQPVPSAADC